MKKKSYHKLIFIFILPFILQSCYSEKTVDSKILIRSSDLYDFEVQIQVDNEGRGNIHTLDISKYEFESAHWIYINSNRGKLNASDIILTYYHEKTEYPWVQSKLKGFIEFLNDSLLINLKTPIYKEGNKKPQYWNDYKYNGKYLIEFTNEKIK